MKGWLWKYFVPHLENAYRPHFLLGKNISHFLGLVIGFEFALFVLPTLFFTSFIDSLNLSSVLPGTLSVLTNEERLQNGLSTLRENTLLTQAARMKAEDMASKGYFAHISPEGKNPWYWFKAVGYDYAYAGENLAVSFTDSKEVTQAWMNSPTHRANIIGRNYTEIGTGVATGTYKGKESVFVAQVYAKPKAPNLAVGAVPEAPSLKSALLSPRETMNAVLYVVFAIIIAALGLNIFIKLDKQYPDLIRNGLFAMAFVAAVYLANSFVSNEDFETSFFAFEDTETALVGE